MLSSTILYLCLWLVYPFSDTTIDFSDYRVVGGAKDLQNLLGDEVQVKNVLQIIVVSHTLRQFDSPLFHIYFTFA